jgi:hypothetical protein
MTEEEAMIDAHQKLCHRALKHERDKDGVMPKFPSGVVKLVDDAEELLMRVSNQNNFTRTSVALLLAVEKQLVEIRRALRSLGWSPEKEEAAKEKTAAVAR